MIYQIKLKGTNQDDTIVTNSRHVEALQNTLIQIGKIKQGMDNGLPGDLLAMDIREALTYLGHITGEIDVDQDILGTIREVLYRKVTSSKQTYHKHIQNL